MNIETIYKRTMEELKKHVDESSLRDLNDYYSIYGESYLLVREELGIFVGDDEFEGVDEFEVHSGTLPNNEIVNVIIHEDEIKFVLMDDECNSIYCSYI